LLLLLLLLSRGGKIGHFINTPTEFEAEEEEEEGGDKASVWQMINEVVGKYRLHRE
jgi:hypothetical protein